MIVKKPIRRKFSIDGFYSAFRFEWDEHFIFAGESHDLWEAVYVKSGAVEVTEDENVYTLGAGNIIYHAPMDFHRIKSAQGSSPVVLVISFSHTGELPPSLKNGVFSLEPSLRGEYEQICKMALEFRGDIRKEDNEPCAVDADSVAQDAIEDDRAFLGQELADRLSLFLIKLSSRSSRGGISMAKSAVEYRKIVSFMSGHIAESLTLSEIAEKNNVSISYVKLLFATYAGISPKVYFNQLRLCRATELLSEGMSITKVADIMNFSSPAYFSAFYKKLSGGSPSERQRSV